MVIFHPSDLTNNLVKKMKKGIYYSVKSKTKSEFASISVLY